MKYGTKVYYTLDGSEPDKTNGTRYDSDYGIVLSEEGEYTLKYIAYNAKGIPSENKEEVYKIELLLKQAHVTIEERKVVPAALKREEETGAPAAAMELPDGRIVTGKTSELLGASSALLLNALKELAGIEHDKHVISPEALKPIQALKTEYLGSKNPRLHSDETLIALSISAADNKDAKLALQQIPKLKGCQVHTSVLLSQVDILEFRKLGVELTCEPKSEHAKKLQK